MESQIDKTISRSRNAFSRGDTKPIEFRVQQLKALNQCLEENRQQWMTAIKQDLMKPSNEALIAEIGWSQLAIKEQLLQIKECVKPKPVFNSFLLKQKAFTVCEPYGVVLIISPWNFPIQLSFLPLIGAIAAGNCVIIKPSEIAPSTSKALAELLPEYLNKECYHVIEGGIEETKYLLDKQFDYIFFTGSTHVAKFVAQAAAKHLTPVTLELGGKSPVYIDDSVPDMEIVCRRVLWGKFTNAGQICIGPDYLLCSPSVQKKFVECAQKVIKEFYGQNPKESKDFGRIVNEMHFKRISNLIESSGKAVIGGDTDADQKYISPTILVDVKTDDPVMNEEIFGPVLPIITVSSAEEAIDFIRKRNKPLALYLFSTDDIVIQKFLKETSSGGVCVNDVIMQATVHDLPFGGVGASGMGRYHGKVTFTTFSNEKSVLIRKYNNSLQESYESCLRHDLRFGRVGASGMGRYPGKTTFTTFSKEKY